MKFQGCLAYPYGTENFDGTMFESKYRSQVRDYLDKGPRHRIIFSETRLEGVSYLDIGKSLSELKSSATAEYGPLELDSTLANLIQNYSVETSAFGKVLAIKNLGFLFEGKLEFEFETFLARISRQQLVVILWDGDLDGNQLYFLTRKDGVEFDLSGLNYLMLK